MIPRALLVLGLLWPLMTEAADPTPAIRLELNRLEARDARTCRFWLVLNNQGDQAIDPLRLDLVVFGRDGIVARRVAVDVGPVPASRRLVRIFDLADEPCDRVGEVLLNDLLACGSTEVADRTACMARIALASRVDGVALLK